jgi:hypothetical protein
MNRTISIPLHAAYPRNRYCGRVASHRSGVFTSKFAHRRRSASIIVELTLRSSCCCKASPGCGSKLQCRLLSPASHCRSAAVSSEADAWECRIESRASALLTVHNAYHRVSPTTMYSTESRWKCPSNRCKFSRKSKTCWQFTPMSLSRDLDYAVSILRAPRFAATRRALPDDTSTPGLEGDGIYIAVLDTGVD